MTISSRRAGWILGILAFSVAIDQVTKKLASLYLRSRPPIIYWKDVFRFDYVENPGAFLSLGGTMSPAMRFWVLNVAVAGFLVFLLLSMLMSKTMTRLQTIALALVLGGGISNLIDRFFRPNGQVVDFMNMGIGTLRTGVFNVADVLIMAGIIVFALTNFLGDQPARSNGKAA